MSDIKSLSNRFASFVQLLMTRAGEYPDRLAYIFLSEGEKEDGSLTFAELEMRARAAGALLQELNAGGERALLLFQSGLDYIVAFYGCLYGGAIAVPVYPPRADRNFGRLHAIIEDSKPLLALTTTSVFSNLERWLEQMPGLKSLRWVNVDQIDLSRADSWRDCGAHEETIAFLQYTSGSTSMPKGVIITHGNLLYNQAMMREGLGHDDDTIIVSWLPLYHDMGLIGNILASMYNRVPCWFMSPSDFLKNPLRWLNAISRYRATFSGGPNFAYDLCVQKARPEQLEGLDLSSWKVAFNGSEPVRAGTLKRFAQTFAPYGFRPEALYPCYGLAEATLFVSGGDYRRGPTMTIFDKVALEQHRAVERDNLDGTQVLVSCGRSWLEEQIVIADPANLTRCQEGQVGEIWLSGPALARGYWAKPEISAQTFEAYLSDTGEGPFLRTGDLGFLYKGELYVAARIKDLIIIRGRTLYPQDIELTVESSHFAVRPGCSVAFAVDYQESERLVIVAELSREHRYSVEPNEVVQSIRAAVALEHDVEVFAVSLIPPATLPKTSSGKVQRSATRAAFLAESLETIYKWQAPVERRPHALPAMPTACDRTLEMIKAWLAIELASRLKIDLAEIEMERPVASYGLDSVVAAEIVSSVEQMFDVEFPINDLFMGEPNIARIAALIFEQLRRKSSGRPLEAGEERVAAPKKLSDRQV